MKIYSKEYDIVQYLVQKFQEENITEISWKDFQKKFQAIAQRYNKLIQEIRNNKPIITLNDLNEWLWNYSYESKYEITTDTYYSPEHSFRDAKQLVVQINRGAELENLAKGDEILYNFFRTIYQTAMASGHPVKSKTIGWFRLDEIDEEYILIDEIQSDMLNAVEDAKTLLGDIALEEIFQAFPKEIKQELYNRFNTNKDSDLVGIMYSSKNQLLQVLGGGNKEKALKKLDELKEKMKELSIGWIEDGLSSIIDYARGKGIKYVLLHTPESITERDPNVGRDKLNMYYTQTAKQFGFTKQHIELEDIRGTFFVRRAKKINHIGMIKKINKFLKIINEKS